MKTSLPADLSKSFYDGEPTRAEVTHADQALVGEGYTFVGYHGTSSRGRLLIMHYGFDPVYAGSSAGLARGAGLYVARAFGMAEDFSDTATQAGDPDPYTGVVPLKRGRGGERSVLRIYARHFGAMVEGIDYVWGRMGGTNLAMTAHANHVNRMEQEIVFRPRVYEQLGAIPTTGAIERALGGPSPISTVVLRRHEV